MGTQIQDRDKQSQTGSASAIALHTCSCIDCLKGQILYNMTRSLVLLHNKDTMLQAEAAHRECSEKSRSQTWQPSGSSVFADVSFGLSSPPVSMTRSSSLAKANSGATDLRSAKN